MDFVKIIGYLTLFVAVVFLFTLPTMWAVNYLFTPTVLMSLFGIPQLTFWKAFWLQFVCSSLFKGTTYKEKS